VLILTTGTTGRPKGVRHDWARLVNSVRHPDDRSGARWLLAYNLNQFAGIQIVLHVLASRATLVAGASPQPRDAVEAMRALGVTHVSATPTFWRLALPRLGEDELRIEQITLGGEAVPDPLLDQLKRRFPGVRISQVYAANEFGSAVSVRDGRAGLPLSVLDRDEGAEVQFRIVDGELHARSRVGMLGYLGEGDSGDGWRPTGDLVEVRGDRIHFVGRSSEIINVGGVKVHPLPVEEAVGAVEGVEIARAYGRANPVAGQIVALDVVPVEGADTDALAGAIRAACAGLPPAAQPRRIRFVESLEMRDTKLARS
jgi:acyl-coenzyme A synthetase/AMP-(fatty) acid ligase